MSNDLWRTPPEVFQTLNKEFNFIADMAASYKNKLCDVYFDEEGDSLGFSWADYMELYCEKVLGKYVWCNPPYSNPMPWVKQALEAQKNGLGTVMLLNADCSVGWFSEALQGVSEVRFIVSDGMPEGKTKHSSGRIGFLDGEGNAQGGNNKPQFVLVFNPFKLGKPVVTTYIKKSELMGEVKPEFKTIICNTEKLRIEK